MSSKYMKVKWFKPVKTLDIRYCNVLMAVAKPNGTTFHWYLPSAITKAVFFRLLLLNQYGSSLNVNLEN